MRLGAPLDLEALDADIDQPFNMLQGSEVLGGNPTTSFLTATTLIYAIGAGITAAAGTRLALQ